MVPHDGSREEVIAAIRSGDRFLVTSHVHPDGDSVGSVLAIGWLLKALGKTAILAMADPVPPSYAFLPGCDEIRTFDALTGDFDSIIVVDCGELERIGALNLPERPQVINVDHHLQNRFASPRYCRTDAAATGELIYDLIRSFGATLDRNVATCLYTAILTDTGGFRYANTSAETLRTAADLLALGVSPSHVAEQVYEIKPLGSLRLLAAVLSTLETTRCGRVAWLAVTRETVTKCDVDASETEGFVNFARMVSGVKIGLMFREMANGEIKVSWRSRDGVDVSRMAAQFGGGGHLNAAGCEIKADLGEAIRMAVGVALASLDAGCEPDSAGKPR